MYEISFDDNVNCTYTAGYIKDSKNRTQGIPSFWLSC